MNEDTRVPLQVSWLHETGMLVKAAGLLGHAVDTSTAGEDGVYCLAQPDGAPYKMEWDDHLLFTLAQLKELGFE